MAWTTPKTDWEETTFINGNDVNRIVDNLKFLRELASHLYTSKIKSPSVVEKDYDGALTDNYERFILYSDEMNDIEDCLTSLNVGTLLYDIGDQAVYQDNGAMPDFNELNRIESAMFRLYTEMTIQHENLDRLAFTLGGERKFKI